MIGLQRYGDKRVRKDEVSGSKNVGATIDFRYKQEAQLSQKGRSMLRVI